MRSAEEKTRGLYVAGTGAAGTGFAAALAERGFRVTGLWNRGERGRAEAERLLGRPVDSELGRGLEEAELVLVCVADEAVPEVGAGLARTGLLRPGTVVAHTSGCLASTALGELAGSSRGSLHPLVALPEPVRAARALVGASFAVEGEPAAVAMLREVARALEGRVFEVRSADKPRYHAAAVMASNLIVALLHDAIGEAEAAGVENARQLLGQLAAGAVANVMRAGAPAALTGPVVRGDVATVRAHLAVLSREAGATYRELSLRALELARSRGLEPAVVAELERLLT